MAIALHGAVANAVTWAPLARLLAPDVDVDARDLPGHGARRGEPFDLERAVVETVERIATFVPRPVVLVGDSLGGYLALLAAARRPLGLRGVVAAGCCYVMRERSILTRLATLDVPLLRIVGPARVERCLVAVLRRIAPRDAAAIGAAGLATEARAATIEALAATDIIAAVQRIDVPVVYAGGAWDPAFLASRRFASATPHATRVIVPRAGHGIGLTHPDAIARAIRLLRA